MIVRHRLGEGWTDLLVGMSRAQNQPTYLAPVPTAPPVSPTQWAIFGVGAVVVVGALAAALRSS